MNITSVQDGIGVNALFVPPTHLVLFVCVLCSGLSIAVAVDFATLTLVRRLDTHSSPRARGRRFFFPVHLTMSDQKHDIEHLSGSTMQRQYTAITLTPEQFESMYMQPRNASMSSTLASRVGNPTPL